MKREYSICIKGYEFEGICFDTGYISDCTGARSAGHPEHWRYATEKEMEEFKNTPFRNRPNGNYYK